MGGGERDRLQAEFARAAIPLHMNVRRFVAVKAVEEEAIWAREIFNGRPGDGLSRAGWTRFVPSDSRVQPSTTLDNPDAHSNTVRMPRRFAQTHRPVQQNHLQALRPFRIRRHRECLLAAEPAHVYVREDEVLRWDGSTCQSP